MPKRLRECAYAVLRLHGHRGNSFSGADMARALGVDVPAERGQITTPVKSHLKTSGETCALQQGERR